MQRSFHETRISTATYLRKASNSLYALCQICFVCTLAAFMLCGQSDAQESLFRTIDVEGKLKIDVPKHWLVRDINERRNVAASAEASAEAAKVNAQPNDVSALSVISLPEPTGAIIRVVFIKIDELSQEQLKAQIREDKEGVLRDLRDVYREEFLGLRKVLAGQNIRLIGEEKVELDTIGSRIAFKVTYRRTSPVEPGATFSVVQYHVPVGKEKVFVSLSHRDSDRASFGPILDRVKRSIRFR